jgi:hypothetical protein
MPPATAAKLGNIAIGTTVTVPAEASATKPAAASTPETASSAGTYGQRVETLIKDHPTALTLAARTKVTLKAGEGNTAPLPLEVTRNGNTMDVLFTVAVGVSQNDRGRPRPLMPAMPGAVQGAVDNAHRNYAVVRDPSDAAGSTFLMELLPAEIAEGRASYSTAEPTEGQPADSRLFTAIPGREETPLSLSVADPAGQYEATSMSFNMGTAANELNVRQMGPPGSYALMAGRL